MGRKPECKLAGLRTETAYKAGTARQVGHASRSRSQSVAKVNAEPVQEKFTFLSGEICLTYLGLGLARKPGPRAPTGGWSAKATRCWAEVSRRHSTRLHTPLQRERPERDAQVRATLTSLRQEGRPAHILSHKVVNRQRRPTGKLAWTDVNVESV